jgi:hypothetical protein
MKPPRKKSSTITTAATPPFDMPLLIAPVTGAVEPVDVGDGILGLPPLGEAALMMVGDKPAIVPVVGCVVVGPKVARGSDVWLELSLLLIALVTLLGSGATFARPCAPVAL